MNNYESQTHKNQNLSDTAVAADVAAYRHLTCLFMCLHICSGSVNVIRYILEEATIHPNSHLFRITNGKRSSLSVLYDALIMRETFGSNTPLHLCSEMLANSSHVQPNNRHLCCIISLLDFVEDRQQRVEQCE